MHTYISDISKSYLEVIRDGEITQWLGHLDLIWLNVGPFFRSLLRIGMKIHSLASQT